LQTFKPKTVGKEALKYLYKAFTLTLQCEGNPSFTVCAAVQFLQW